MRTETRHSIVLTAGTGVTAVLGLIYVVFVQRTLGRDRSADFIAALSFIAFCQIGLGPINGTVARFTAQFAHRHEVGKIRTLCRAVAARVALLGLLGLAVGLVVLTALTGLWHFESPLSLLTAYSIVYVTLILSVARGALRGAQAFGHLNLNTILEAAIRLGLGVWLLQTVRSSEAGLAAYLGALIVILAVSHVQLRSIWRRSRRAPIDGGTIKRFTGRMFVLMLTSAAFQNVDMLTVKHYLAASDAGLYGAAFTLARSMGALATPFTTLLLPLLATMHEQGQRATGAFLRVSAYFLALAAIPVALFGLWPDRVIGLVYTDDFAAAGDILLAVTVARLLGYLCHLLALVGAATNDFGMLRVYVPGLLLQSIALAVWHDTSEQVANVMIVGQGVTLAAMGAYYYVPCAPRGWPTSSGGGGGDDRRR